MPKNLTALLYANQEKSIDRHRKKIIDSNMECALLQNILQIPVGTYLRLNKSKDKNKLPSVRNGTNTEIVEFKKY